MRKVKTFNVEKFKNQLNKQIAESNCTDNERLVLCSTLEMLLMQTGNYRGFKYLEWRPTDWIAAGKPEGKEKAAFIGNESRRHYY